MMKNGIKKYCAILMICFMGMSPTPARADFWGGDLPLLTQILFTAIQQLTQLQQILSTGANTLAFMFEINAGIRTALDLARTSNTGLSPGVLSQLQNVSEALSAVEQLYGAVPNTAEAPMQRTTDQSVAEAIHLHNEAFRYAQNVDPEADRIKQHALFVSPQGAGKLTAQSIGVLIHVMNQLLRTNAAMLKLQSEQLAMGNHRQKLESEHFKMQYEGLARAFGELRPEYSLPSLSRPTN